MALSATAARRSIAALGILLAIVLGGCSAAGSSGSGSVSANGKTLTIYASAPSGTADAAGQTDILDAERLAFESAQSQVTAVKLRFVALTSPKISDDARTAIQDTSAIAYIGEAAPGTSADSIGITNALDIIQVSPTDTALQLTQSSAAIPGSPDRYYEALSSYGHTFAREVGTTAQEARALVGFLASAKSVYVAQDGSEYGRALAAVGGKIGKYTIQYKQLDDSTAQAGKWDPAQTTNDAHSAINDSTTIGYIGEFNSGASAISIPLLDQAGIPQISPSNTAVGLTSNAPGASPGEPQKYYPTGKRNYVRIVPKDTIQAAAQVTLWKAAGCKKVYIFNDQEVYGAGLAKNAVLAAPTQGVTIAGNAAYDPKAANYRSQASAAAATGADCVFESNIDNNNAVQLTKDIASAMPNAKIFAPDGDTDPTFFDPKQGGIPASIASRVTITVATLDPSAYPAAGQAFFKQYQAKYGTPVAYAIYGYESMALMLDAIKRASASGAVSKAAVIQALFATKNRQSVLGTYSIDPNGDTTLTTYGAWKISGGNFVFSHTVQAKAS